MNYIDAHFHFTDDRLFLNQTAVVEQALGSNLSTFVLAGTEPQDWIKQKQLHDQFSKENVLKIYQNYGLHPWWVEKGEAFVRESLATLSRCASQADGIGEAGLDFASKRDSKYFDRVML